MDSLSLPRKKQNERIHTMTVFGPREVAIHAQSLTGPPSGIEVKAFSVRKQEIAQTSLSSHPKPQPLFTPRSQDGSSNPTPKPLDLNTTSPNPHNPKPQHPKHYTRLIPAITNLWGQLTMLFFPAGCVKDWDCKQSFHTCRILIVTL